MIDIVIPTMWKVHDFERTLESYVNLSCINKIILIDNNPSSRPKSSILKNSKIELVCYGRNIFVNPAWNEGYYRCKSPILAIINDDITVDKDVFDMVINFKPKFGDVIGVNLRGRQDNYKIDDVIDTKEEIVDIKYDPTTPIGGQAWAFGICMFMLRETYSIIPSLYKVWYGDDYLAQKAKRVYAINSNKIKGTISETLKSYNDPNSEINQRIKLDSMNLIKFDHFINGKNWDIPYNIINMHQRQRSQGQTNKDIFLLEYEKAKKIPSDINENLYILYELAKECSTVIEMGVRTGVSTRAFLAADVELLSFDLFLDPLVQKLFEKAAAVGKSVQYVQADVINIEVEEADLIFIDTLHTYSQLRQELLLHGNKAKKYLIFHDTYTYGLKGEDPRDNKGLLPALIEFMIDNPHWRFKTFKTNNNGMTVLERV